MLQLYFLSILCNGIAGFLFVYGDALEGKSDDDAKSSTFAGGFKLIVGIVAAVTGVLKLLMPVRGVPILGDLLPAVAGMIAGFMLVYGFYRDNVSKSDDAGKLDMFGGALIVYKKPIGIACIAVAVLHFLFYGALFL